MSSHLHSTSNERNPSQSLLPEAAKSLHATAEHALHENTPDDVSDIASDIARMTILPELEDMREARRKLFTDVEKTEAWEKMANVVKEYSDETVARWDKEIDTLLVYAGLFSAILTAFNVQSYQLLTPPPPPPSPDPVLLTLQQISAQLNSFTVKEPFVNSTILGISPTISLTPTPIAPKWAVWLNVLWFSSLIFSLSVASVGIMVKQWLNEYNCGLSGTSRETARMRQYRLNSLKKWRVGAITASLSVLLQAALGLYFAGLLILLWQLNTIVAATASALVGILSLFTVITTIIPSIPLACDCCYLSPLSLVVFDTVRLMKTLLVQAMGAVADLWHRCYTGSMFRVGTVLKWSDRDDRVDSVCASWDKFRKYRIRLRLMRLQISWRARELSIVRKSKHSLDGDTVATAYTTSLNPVYLDEAAPCFSEMNEDQISICCEKINTVMKRSRDTPDDLEVTTSYGWLTSQHIPALITCKPESCITLRLPSALDDGTVTPLDIDCKGDSWDIPRVNMELLNLTMAWIACGRCRVDLACERCRNSIVHYRFDLSKDIMKVLALRLRESRRHCVPLKFVTWQYISTIVISSWTYPRRYQTCRLSPAPLYVLIFLCTPGVILSNQEDTEKLKSIAKTLREYGIRMLLTTVLHPAWNPDGCDTLHWRDQLIILQYLRSDGELSGFLEPTSAKCDPNLWQLMTLHKLP